jgi:hypothetical protein
MPVKNTPHKPSKETKEKKQDKVLYLKKKNRESC